MKERVKQRIALALKCKVNEVPEDPQGLKVALENRRKVLKAEKVKKHG